MVQKTQAIIFLESEWANRSAHFFSFGGANFDFQSRFDSEFIPTAVNRRGSHSSNHTFISSRRRRDWIIRRHNENFEFQTSSISRRGVC